MNSANIPQNSSLKSKYISPLAAWALSFGCLIGWGSFVMPGTTFLPIAGPMGSVIGLLIGAAVMLVIGVNYRTLMTRYPDSGGAYTYAGKVLGGDHGFLCAWMLLLTYLAIIWANSTALSLIFRFLFGDVFCFGFSYEIAGYTVYFGEVLVSVALLGFTLLICLLSNKLAVRMQILFALLLFVGVCVAFTAVVVHRGGFSGLSPAFSGQGAPVSQILGVVILAPWAYIGFESISHSTKNFRFSVKKSLPIFITALVAGAVCYSMLVICAGLAVPDGFSNWGEYISSLGSLSGIKGLPTFYAAREAMGDAGLAVLGVSAFGGVMTGMLGYYVALSRMLRKMSADKMMPSVLSRTNRKDVPYAALLIITGISCVIPFFGRTAISWIVDVTTIGAVIVYTYTSISAFVVGRREHKTAVAVSGCIGTVISLIFALIYLMPTLFEHSGIAAPSYLILIIWSILGMLVFRFLIKRDSSRRLGKSEAVWIILSFLVLLVSTIWIQQSAELQALDAVGDIRSAYLEKGISDSGAFISERLIGFTDSLHTNIYVQAGLIVCSLAIIFSIFAIIKRREQAIEAERLLAEQNSRSKSTFLSNMSHDLRTPMNAVIGYTALAMKEEGVPDTVKDYLEKIEISGINLLSLINDILDMTRIESGKVELDPEPTDLCVMLEHVRTVFAIQMQDKDLDFPIICDIRDQYVICDKNRLTRIIQNFVSNAYKFTPDGGFVEVVLTQLEDGEDGTLNYKLTVTDNGIGMSPDFVEHLFDSFTRERTSTVSGIQGTGLGMSIAKSMIELMGGTVSVETEQGKGTRFTVLLPMYALDEDEKNSLIAVENAAKEKHDFTGKRLLLVEDNMINRDIAYTFLTAEGFAVDTAENGRIAVDMVAQNEPDTYDAILMDIQMPVMDGYEATYAIRSMSDSRSRIPIIAITANTFEEDRKNIEKAGMNAHVFKPFIPEEMVAVISEHLND